MTLGERIKLIRGEVSREKFSPMTGISKTTLVNYETGASSPTAEYLNKLLIMFPEINPAWLLTGEGEMNKGYTIIRKDRPEGFGRAKELTYKIYPVGFRSRLQKEMGGLDDRKPVWLSKESGLPIDKIIEFLTGEAIPTVDELIALAEALSVSEIWLAEGDTQKISEQSEKEPSERAEIDLNRLKTVMKGVDAVFKGNPVIEIRSNLVGYAYNSFVDVEHIEVADVTRLIKAFLVLYKTLPRKKFMQDGMQSLITSYADVLRTKEKSGAELQEEDRNVDDSDA